MSRKRANAGVRVCALVSFVVLAAAAFTPVPALALPEGRVYEQVTPEFKAGYGVFGERAAFALDGESVEFSSLGAFSGSGESLGASPYVAHRTISGWTTSALFPPQTTESGCAGGLEEVSPDMSRFEYGISPGATGRACEVSATITVAVRRPGAASTPVSPALTTASGEENSLQVSGASLDLSRVIVAKSGETPSTYFVPSPAECGTGFTDERLAGSELFEAEACALRRVGVDNSGQQISLYCNVELGGAHGGPGAVSEPAASEVFFSTGIDSRTPSGSEAECSDHVAHPLQVFARVHGERTLTVSQSLPGGCTEEPCKAAAQATPKDAEFQGASQDGSKVFFTTTQPLVNEDKNTANDLYMATIGCAGGAEGEACGSAPRKVTSLALVSHDPNAGQAAEVQERVVAIAADGSHVYFVATGDLLGEAEREALEREGRPVPRPGARNLYASATATGALAFVADLCSGPQQSGALSDASCPNQGDDSTLWSAGNAHQAQTTGDGRFLLFTSYGQLVSTGPERDADTTSDIYRYDALTGDLRRISVGVSGFDANGNNSTFGASIPDSLFQGQLQQQYELGFRAISEDGSTVVFDTAEPLAPSSNGHQDVYLWHEGRVEMISSGGATEPDFLLGVSPSGRDVYFFTTAGLVSGDTDGMYDIYDARIGGGFPPAPAARESCSADACLGPLSPPTPLLVPGSISQQGGGNLTAAPSAAAPKHGRAKCKPPAKRHAKPVKHKKACKAARTTTYRRHA